VPWSFGSVPKFEDCPSAFRKIVDELERGTSHLKQALKLFERPEALGLPAVRNWKELKAKLRFCCGQNGKYSLSPMNLPIGPSCQEIVPLKACEVQQPESPTKQPTCFA